MTRHDTSCASSEEFSYEKLFHKSCKAFPALDECFSCDRKVIFVLDTIWRIFDTRTLRRRSQLDERCDGASDNRLEIEILFLGAKKKFSNLKISQIWLPKKFSNLKISQIWLQKNFLTSKFLLKNFKNSHKKIPKTTPSSAFSSPFYNFPHTSLKGNFLSSLSPLEKKKKTFQ